MLRKENFKYWQTTEIKDVGSNYNADVSKDLISESYNFMCESTSLSNFQYLLRLYVKETHTFS